MRLAEVYGMAILTNASTL